MVSREETPFDKLSWREKEAYLKAFTQRGRKLQDQANARLQVQPPGKPPTQRGIGEADRAEARANIEARKTATEQYLVDLRAQEAEKQKLAAEEAEIRRQVDEFEAKLRTKLRR